MCIYNIKRDWLCQVHFFVCFENTEPVLIVRQLHKFVLADLKEFGIVGQPRLTFVLSVSLSP